MTLIGDPRAYISEYNDLQNLPSKSKAKSHVKP